LITQGKWLRISHSAKAVLPAIGIHVDNNSIAFPGMKIIRQLSGCIRPETARGGIYSLIEWDLIEKKRQGRHNIYYLKPPAIYQGGSYYPMSEEFIKYTWIGMSYIEKAVFGVLAVKATINRPELISAGDSDIFGAGYIQKRKFTRLAGVSFPSWDIAINGLILKEIITFDEENDYTVYK